MLNGWASDTYSGVAVAITVVAGLALSIFNTLVEWRSKIHVPLEERRRRRAQNMTVESDILRIETPGTTVAIGHSLSEMDEGVDAKQMTLRSGQLSTFRYRFRFPSETDVQSGDIIRVNGRPFKVVSAPVVSQLH